MASNLHLCDRLLTLNADFRQEFKESCARCQGEGGGCLVALMAGALHAENEDRRPSAVPSLAEEIN